MPSFFISRFDVQSIPSPLVGWKMTLSFFLSGFSLHGERAKELLAGPADIEARTPCPRFRDARAKASAGVGQAWQANLSGSFSPTGWGGRRLIERASLPCLTIGKYFLSFFSPLLRPSPTTKSNTSPVLPSLNPQPPSEETFCFFSCCNPPLLHPTLYCRISFFN